MKIFSVGQASYDITIPVASFPKEGTKTFVGKKIECGGGTASNVAVLLSDWYEKVYFIGAIGNDFYGKKVADSLYLHGVDTKYLSILDDANTTTTSIVSSCDNGERTSFVFKDQSLKSYNNNFTFAKPDVIFFDGEDNLTDTLIIKKNKTFKILGTSINYKAVIKYAKDMNYILISEYVAKKITGLKIKSNDKESLKEVHKALISELGNKNIIITLGEHGSFSKVNGIYQIIPSINIEVKDKVAAGDIFFGAFTYFITHNYDLKKAMRLANIAGAISATRVGGRFSIPSKEEVLSYDR